MRADAITLPVWLAHSPINSGVSFSITQSVTPFGPHPPFYGWPYTRLALVQVILVPKP